MTGTDLAVIEADELVEQPSDSLIPAESPADFMAQAGRVAVALVDLVEKRGLFTKMGNKKHLHVDAWCSLGALLGSVGGSSVFAVPDGDPEMIEVNGVAGVRVKMKAVTINGRVVGGATGFCMRDEPTWKNRPLYALAGMAETRATSRALRKPLGFIVELAGYAATSAEEMPREKIEDAEIIVDPDGRAFPDQREPAPGQFEPPPGAVDGDPNLATAAQLRNVNRLMGELVKQDETGQTTRDSLKAEVQLAFGVTSSKELTKLEASQVIDGFAVRAGEK
jgi:hypothetical protein